VTLADRDLLELDRSRGSTVQSLRGTLWITQHGDIRDIVLSAGDAWTIERDGPTVVEAQGDALLRIVGRASAGATVRHAAMRARERVRRWIQTLLAPYARRRPLPYY
jgi:hypothetical protein